MEKIKVLIVAGAMDVGGIENQLMHLLRKADKEKFQIDFTTTVDHPFYGDEIEALGAKLIHLPPTEGRHFLRYCKALYRVLKEGEYDVVHSHELFHSGMVLLTARLAGVKHRFVHAHNWCDGNGLGEKQSIKRRAYNYVMQRMILDNGTCFLACSSLAGGFLYGEKTKQQKNYHLVFNSVDTGKFLANYDQVETGEFTDDGWINVIQVGRFTPVKNQLFTVQIAAELKRRGEKIRILCAGNDGNDYEKSVRDAIAREGVEDYMKLLGIRKDIDVLMRKSKAFLLPSTYEGMPLVMIEAQAAGLPCVIGDTFSHEVDYGIGLANWLPIPGEAEHWADAVIKAVATPKPPKQTVEQVIRKNGFDSNSFADKLCKLYEEAASR